MTPLVAIAGCPNTGKTTLFNRLTGATQTVGNWPGQTVDRHEGVVIAGTESFRLVDLPGTYGLCAVSAEESITTGFLAEKRPDVVITVVDATTLTPGLHLASQIAEAGFRQVVALNMSDVAERRGIEIDDSALERALGARVVRTVARRGDGIDELMAAAADAALDSRQPAPLVLDYGPVIERHLGGMVSTVLGIPEVRDLGAARWMVLQLLAGDERTTRLVAAADGGSEVISRSDRALADIGAQVGFDVEIALAEQRLGLVSGILARATGPGS
ncbi:50S ribosome-binding GTPase, partial [bacterium]|nr:50S ribosome-binding GTPase [bacterium]